MTCELIIPNRPRVELPGGWTPWRRHEVQARAWRSSARTVHLCAGRGSGKTEMARRRIVRYLRVKKPWHDPLYFYGMPTYNQCRQKIRDKILTLIPRWYLTKVPGDSTMEFKTVFGSWLFLYGLDVPARVEGEQYDGAVTDENSDLKPGIYGRTIRPALTHRNGWHWRIGVPKRYGVGAKEFKLAYERGLRNEAGWESYTWPSWDILSEEEIRQARDDTDVLDFEEQYGGRWLEAGGRAYHAFDKDESVRSCSHDPTKLMVVGCDFNVTPMSWVLMQLYKLPDGTVGVDVIDEIWLIDTNTQRTLDVLWNRYGEKHKGGWLFIGDAAASQRKTSASMSDYMIIRSDQRFKAAVRFPDSNPRIKDRVASVNRMLCSASHVRRLHVDRGCKRLIDDLENLAVKPNGEPDDSDDMAKHISDALGYPIHKLFPVRAEDMDEEPQGTISIGDG